jgi:demethylmenaquinone methyltransferase / 2-methoxy-6-polyprenyl-1,4-benzoquinol methylase
MWRCSTKMGGVDAPTPPTWTDRDMGDPHGAADKAQRVQAMFAAIAHSYDLNNRLHSLGRDQAWRRAAVKAANLRPGEVVLDVACGTGDVALAFARAGAGRVMGVDFTVEMLQLAERKAERGKAIGPAAQQSGDAGPEHQTSNIEHQTLAFVAGDALRLPIADASVDIVSIAFGIRNVADPAAALREFYRVLRPGGRVVVLEFSMPESRMWRGLYQFYFHQVLPRTATWIARDRTGAYKYLPRSVSTFIDRQGMLAAMGAAGFADPAMRRLTLGIAVVYRGVKM